MSPDPLADMLQAGYRYDLSLTHDPGSDEKLLHDAWLTVLRAGGSQNKGYLFKRHPHPILFYSWSAYGQANLLGKKGGGDGSRFFLF